MRLGFSLLTVSVEIAGIMLCFLGILLAILLRETISPRPRRWFMEFYGCLLLDLWVCFASAVLRSRSAPPGWLSVLSVLHMILSPALGYIVTFYLLDTVDRERGRMMQRIAVGVLFALHLVLVFLGHISALYFRIDAQGNYVRGPMYWMFPLETVLPLVIDMTLLIWERNRFTRREKAAFWTYCALPAAAVLLSLWVNEAIVIYATIAAALTMFIFILADHVDRYRRQERENADMRLAVMLSQIRPHFLYNSLSVIQNLCHGAAPEAEAATIKFSRYLRGNMNALTAAPMIPFADELAHTKNYLELEQMRFGDGLSVSIDAGAADFVIPPLTLQPIAENAVRHGVRKKESGCGAVSIRTREHADCWEVSVTDDGPGFDPTRIPTDGAPHIGLQNVRERLGSVCGGTLRIDSRAGEGTTVTIILPKENASC